MAKKDTINLLEVSMSNEANVDKENGIIRNVKIIGNVSKNGRDYTKKAIDDVVRISEGIDVNIDHPDKDSLKSERKSIDGWGVLRNTYSTDRGGFGDLHYIKSHPLTEMLIERIGRFGDKIGLSINGSGKTTAKKGKMIVESVSSMNSVDIVTRPATNTTLFESQGCGRCPKDILSDSYVGILESFDGVAGVANNPIKQSELNGEEEVKAAFKTLINAIIEDPEFTAVTALAKIRDVLNSQEQLLGKAKTEEDSGELFNFEKGENDVPEEKDLKKLKEQVSLLESENCKLKVNSMLKAAGVSLEDDLVEAICKMDEEKISGFIEKLKESERQEQKKRPEYSPPKNGTLAIEESAKTPEDFARSILG